LIKEGTAKSSAEVPEERDPTYEAMLSQMVGRITAKPGGKLEMGEVRLYYHSSFVFASALFLWGVL